MAGPGNRLDPPDPPQGDLDDDHLGSLLKYVLGVPGHCVLHLEPDTTRVEAPSPTRKAER
jgi:hypothetical protein